VLPAYVVWACCPWVCAGVTDDEAGELARGGARGVLGRWYRSSRRPRVFAPPRVGVTGLLRSLRCREGGAVQVGRALLRGGAVCMPEYARYSVQVLGCLQVTVDW
jgi:hypothetical protein